ncbi:MAG: hypothetical protein JW882_08615 [Deltaproteobacteria bacterium]|nr:hypothetical protein [Deltaproteobacteria bacterium]
MPLQKTINIWDENISRVTRIEKNLAQAMRNMGISAKVQINSEPPHLSRLNLIGSTPAIQIDSGEFWRHTAGKVITVEQFEHLLGKLQKMGIL